MFDKLKDVATSTAGIALEKVNQLVTARPT